MATTKNWMQSAVKKPGSLRATAARSKGISKKTGNIKSSWLKKAVQKGGLTAKRARLAMTFKKYRPTKRK